MRGLQEKLQAAQDRPTCWQPRRGPSAGGAALDGRQHPRRLPRRPAQELEPGRDLRSAAGRRSRSSAPASGSTRRRTRSAPLPPSSPTWRTSSPRTCCASLGVGGEGGGRGVRAGQPGTNRHPGGPAGAGLAARGLKPCRPLPDGDWPRHRGLHRGLGAEPCGRLRSRPSRAWRDWQTRRLGICLARREFEFPARTSGSE